MGRGIAKSVTGVSMETVGEEKKSLCIKTKEQISPMKLPRMPNGCCYEVIVANQGPADLEWGSAS